MKTPKEIKGIIEEALLQYQTGWEPQDIEIQAKNEGYKQALEWVLGLIEEEKPQVSVDVKLCETRQIERRRYVARGSNGRSVFYNVEIDHTGDEKLIFINDAMRGKHVGCPKKEENIPKYIIQDYQKNHVE